MEHLERWGALAAMLVTLPLCAAPILYAGASFTKEYVVGAKLPPSGIFRRESDGAWKHSGFNHPFIFGFEADSGDATTLLVAAGNGLIRAAAQAEQWTILTGSDVTELRDVSLDRNGTIYFAHSAGIRATHDGGRTWQELGAGLHRKYTEAIRVDPKHSNVLIAGGEEGIFRSENGGKTWRLVGAGGFQILRIEYSPNDACFWLATTQKGGLFASHDCAKSFESAGNLGVGSNLYDIAFDPTQPGRIAVVGWTVGVATSTDNGKTWHQRSAGLPSPNVTSIAFDPAHSGRLFAAVHEEAVYLSNDAGATWVKDGLEGTHVNRLRFVPETRPR